MLDASCVVKLSGDALDEVYPRIKQKTFGRRQRKDDSHQQIGNLLRTSYTEV